MWGIKKLASESIQPTSDHSEVGSRHMPEQSWAIDQLPTFIVEHNLGIGKVNFYRLLVSLMNQLSHRFNVGWGEFRDRVYGLYRRIETATSEKAAHGDFVPLYCSGYHDG